MSLPDARTIAANSAAPTSRISAESSAGRSEVQHVPRPQAAGWEQDISIPVVGSGGTPQWDCKLGFAFHLSAPAVQPASETVSIGV